MDPWASQVLTGKESTCQVETQVQSPGREDPLGKEMATHASVLAWEIPWTEEPGRLLSVGSQRVGLDLLMKQPPPTLRASRKGSWRKHHLN